MKPISDKSSINNLLSLLETGQEANVLLAFDLAKALGHPPEFEEKLTQLLELYNLVFKHTKQKGMDVQAAIKLFIPK